MDEADSRDRGCVIRAWPLPLLDLCMLAHQLSTRLLTLRCLLPVLLAVGACAEQDQEGEAAPLIAEGLDESSSTITTGIVCPVPVSTSGHPLPNVWSVSNSVSWNSTPGGLFSITAPNGAYLLYRRGAEETCAAYSVSIDSITNLSQLSHIRVELNGNVPQASCERSAIGDVYAYSASSNQWTQLDATPASPSTMTPLPASCSWENNGCSCTYWNYISGFPAGTTKLLVIGKAATTGGTPVPFKVVYQNN